jgi:hypothetical protein
VSARSLRIAKIEIWRTTPDVSTSTAIVILDGSVAPLKLHFGKLLAGSVRRPLPCTYDIMELFLVLVY